MSVKRITRVAVIGTGAVGGFYGAKLHKAGIEVHFLARSDAQVIKEEGLRITSLVDEDIYLETVNVHATSASMPKCDLVLITLKTTANSSLESILNDVADDESVICTLQNGYGLEQSLENLRPNNPIVGGLCFICSLKRAPGVIEHQDFGSIRLGDYNAGTRILDQIVTLFESSNITTQQADSLMQARWEKLVWNIPFNGLSVILDATTKEMLEDSDTRQLIKTIMLEVISVAKAKGYDLDESLADKMIQVTDDMTPYFPSMKGDFDNCRPMEIAAIYQAALTEAESMNIFMPQTQMLNQLLNFMDHG